MSVHAIHSWYTCLPDHRSIMMIGTFSALLALCEGNPPVTGGFPSQRPVTWSFDVFFDLRLNQRLSKQSRLRWFEMPLRSLMIHCNDCGYHLSFIMVKLQTSDRVFSFYKIVWNSFLCVALQIKRKDIFPCATVMWLQRFTWASQSQKKRKEILSKLGAAVSYNAVQNITISIEH